MMHGESAAVPAASRTASSSAPSRAPATAAASSSRPASAGASKQSGPVDPDFVRAPEQQRVERLADFAGGGLGNGGAHPVFIPQVHSAFRSFADESKGGGGRIGNGGGGGKKGTAALSKATSLASIMAPPTALIFPGTFAAVRTAAKNTGRWVLVNIQVDEDFASWRYNRDVWKDECVSSIISSSFVFWQQQVEVEDAASGGKRSNPHAQVSGVLEYLCVVCVNIVAVVL